MELSNFNINFNNRILRILIIALLIFCMVFGGFMIQYSHAELVISTSIIVAATFLVACGVIAQSDVDLYALAQDFITFLGPLAVVLNQTYKWASGATFHITNALMEKLAEYINLKFKADVNGTPVGSISLPGSAWLCSNGVDYSFVKFFDDYLNNLSSIRKNYTPVTESMDMLKLPIYQEPDYPDKWDYLSSYDSSGMVDYYWRRSYYGVRTRNIVGLYRCIYYSDYSKKSYNAVGFVTNDSNVLTVCSPFTTGMPLANSGSPGVTAKANSTYFPQTGKKALTTSVPLTYPESMTGLVTGGINGVRSDIADVGTDVGVISGTLSGLWETVKGIGATVSTGFSSIVGSIAGFFDVSEFSLDLNPLKIGLTKVFPFCIPFDMLRGIKTLASNPTAFVYDIKLDTKFFDINHTVNLAPYRVPILFFRYIVDFWFIWILISRTRDLMKW